MPSWSLKYLIISSAEITLSLSTSRSKKAFRTDTQRLWKLSRKNSVSFFSFSLINSYLFFSRSYLPSYWSLPRLLLFEVACEFICLNWCKAYSSNWSTLFSSRSSIKSRAGKKCFLKVVKSISASSWVNTLSLSKYALMSSFSNPNLVMKLWLIMSCILIVFLPKKLKLANAESGSLNVFLMSLLTFYFS